MARVKNYFFDEINAQDNFELDEEDLPQFEKTQKTKMRREEDGAKKKTRIRVSRPEKEDE